MTEETTVITEEPIIEETTFPAMVFTAPEETTTTLAVSADLSNLAKIDVDTLNAFTYLGTAFIIAFFFFFVVKGVYRLFNMFF